MKNLIIAMSMVASIFISMPVKGQSMGLKGGVNFSTIEETDAKFPGELNPRIGVNFGFISEFPLFKNYSLETGVILNSKGFSAKEDLTVGDRPIKTKLNYNLQYFDIPVSFKGAFSIGQAEKWKVYGSFGPYVGVGLFGQRIQNISIDGDETEHKRALEWGNDAMKDDFKRMDFGLIFGTGIQRDGFNFGVNYYHGFVDISPASGISQSNRVLGVSVGYMLELR